MASGHGIGKSSVLAWLQLWYLFCYKDAQVACTAPTADQMYDVLWKEVAKWIYLLPEPLQQKYEWSTTHVRITESPQTWFARAKTARKEAPEALAGVHGDFVFLECDEASGIPEEIYNTAEGSLTDKNTLVVLPSNPTRLIGYFYNTHHRDKANWQTFSFSCLDSPLVDYEYVERIAALHGEDSDEYRIRVLGQFPKEDAVDDKGYVALLLERDLKQISDEGRFSGDVRLGVDPAGEGSDETVWVLRDRFKAKIVAREKVSNSLSIARKTLTLMEDYKVKDYNVTVDNFGIGANVAKEIALTRNDRLSVHAVNVGEKPDDDRRYINRRAESYLRLKEWFRQGGELVRHPKWEQLLSIRYRREEISGKIKVMGKIEMKKELGIPSPDTADALMLTFVRPDGFSSSRLSGEDVTALTSVY